MALYIFWFLHQTTTCRYYVSSDRRCISFDSYIKPQLLKAHGYDVVSCISFDSYIKPQRTFDADLQGRVVYLLIPTSNHNPPTALFNAEQLYIFWFLHQTTTANWMVTQTASCISFDSYIKPQLVSVLFTNNWVVYLLIPTSNHNSSHVYCTSRWVVYLLIPTSNHNYDWYIKFPFSLYIFWFLHQTTTFSHFGNILNSCISFDSYIKPQRDVVRVNHNHVVYLLIPTSNHNWLVV